MNPFKLEYKSYLRVCFVIFYFILYVKISMSAYIFITINIFTF